MSELKATVTQIERCSFEDGPGLRTVVFFKGCPLHCAWCHNPECIDPAPQTLLYPEKCIGCGQCDKGCFSGARVVCGEEMTADEIFAQILLDRDYYGENGGVTFSGGEPLMHREMLLDLIGRCREAGIHTAVETSLVIFDEAVFSAVDYVMADLKIFDGEKHRQYVGQDNARILEHFRLLDRLGKPILVRTPIIPTVNDTPGEIAAIRDFVRSLDHAVGYELLPYHPLGEPKRQALGLDPTAFSIPSNEQMEELRRYADLSGTT